MDAAEYRVWVRAPDHVRPVDGVDYDQVATERLNKTPQSAVREVLGERRPLGWVLGKLRDGRGPVRSVPHAPDCEEAPAGAPLLDVDRAMDAAEHPGTRLCTLCGAAQELTPMIRGFDHITDSAPTTADPWPPHRRRPRRGGPARRATPVSPPLIPGSGRAAHPALLSPQLQPATWAKRPQRGCQRLQGLWAATLVGEVEPSAVLFCHSGPTCSGARVAPSAR